VREHRNDARGQDAYEWGLALESGFGVRQDIPEATRYYKLAAAQGHEMARKKINISNTTQPRSNASDLQKYARNRLE
jgi:TPR repeat protein